MSARDHEIDLLRVSLAVVTRERDALLAAAEYYQRFKESWAPEDEPHDEAIEVAARRKEALTSRRRVKGINRGL